MYPYLKALHIIFVVTWFAGLFYMPRLFIYSTEANEAPEQKRTALQEQFLIMMRRLWLGITWPSAILTLILGPVVMFNGSWWTAMLQGSASWLLVKLLFVLVLYAYHLSLHYMYRKIGSGQYLWSSDRLRVWNEVATVLLFAIVFLATVKESVSFVWGLAGLLVLMALLMTAVRIYKRFRNSK